MLISYINYGIFKEFSDDCIETKYNEYTCELCLSKFTCRGETKEKKSKTNVFGSFKSFDGNTARFEGGSKCRNYNVNLSAEIKFECGFREEFKLVKKENKCMYKFIYYTMLGCNTYKMNEMFSKYDGLILPVGSGSAKYIENSKNKLSSSNSILEDHLQIGNFGGFPSITIPNGFVNNLPVGVNITGAVKDDINVLNIAYALESNMDYKNMIAKEVE